MRVQGEACSADGPVPVAVRVDVERGEDDREYDVDVLADEVDDVLVVPVVQRSLGDLKSGELTAVHTGNSSGTHLEVLATHAPRELGEERLHDLLEFGGLDDVEDLFNLVEEHDLLGRVDLGPVLEQAGDDLLREARVLLEELDDAVRELGVVQREALDLVQRDQAPCEERLVLVLERERKAVDDRAEDLEQLGDAVVPLRLVHELEEDVVDRAPDERAQVEEFAVDAVQRRLEKVALARVLAVEELEQLWGESAFRCERCEQWQKSHLEDKLLVDVPLGDVGVEVGALDEPQEELVDDLEVRPRELEHGLVLLGVVRVAGRVHRRRDRAEQVRRELVRASVSCGARADRWAQRAGD